MQLCQCNQISANDEDSALRSLLSSSIEGPFLLPAAMPFVGATVGDSTKSAVGTPGQMRLHP